MRLLSELCTERGLAAVINIHDVQLAQRFVQRVVGLRAGRVVYDGPPDRLTPEVLTSIYGEEDWNEAKIDVDDDAPAAFVAIDRDRLQSA
jgi:phosphonate transport system ATP-binding protein